MKFKEGDYIVATTTTHQITFGNIYKIPKTHKDSELIYVQIGNNRKENRCAIFKFRFRKANDKEIQFFIEEGIGCNIKNIGKSFDDNTLYKKGDRVILKSGLNKGINYGTFHGNIFSGAEYVIKRVTKRGNYLTECGEAILINDLIQSKIPSVKEKSGWLESVKNNENSFFNKYTSPKTSAFNSSYNRHNHIMEEEYRLMKERERMLYSIPSPIYMETGKSDSILAMNMALMSQQSVGRIERSIKDKFTQQDPIILKSKKKNNKLIIC